MVGSIFLAFLSSHYIRYTRGNYISSLKHYWLMKTSFSAANGLYNGTENWYTWGERPLDGTVCVYINQSPSPSSTYWLLDIQINTTWYGKDKGIYPMRMHRECFTIKWMKTLEPSCFLEIIPRLKKSSLSMILIKDLSPHAGRKALT